MATATSPWNDLGFARLEAAWLAGTRDMQRSVDEARRWLRGAFLEAAIGWCSRHHGLPVPSLLARVFGNEPVAETAVPEPRVVAGLIPSELQWVKTTEIFAVAASNADAAGRLHSAAAEQIDAASYAFDHLLAEIGPLMIFSREEDEELEVRRFERRPPRVAPKQAAEHGVETAAA